MRSRVVVLVVVSAAVLAAGCKKKKKAGGEPSASPTASASPSASATPEPTPTPALEPDEDLTIDELDPREFSLLSFGGAGGLHATEVADELGLSLIGFSRGRSLNVYTHPGRVEG